MAQKPTPENWLKSDSLWAMRAHFGFVAAYMLQIVIFDSWNLLTHQDVALRWTAAGILLAINTVVWFATRSGNLADVLYRGLLYVLVVADIVFASYNVFWERGMASKAVLLFIIPILLAAVARSRAALMATVLLCVAAYSTAVVRYFNLHYGEGFRVELYGDIFFYSAIFFVVAALVLVFFRQRRTTT